MSSGKECPSCNTRISWWRRKHHIKCKQCGSKLVMANYSTFLVLLAIVPFVFTLLWVFNPMLFIIALAIELVFHSWFINKMLFYKVLNEQ